MGYWDLPEGTDCVEKTWIATKLGTALGNYLFFFFFWMTEIMREIVFLFSAAMGAIFGMTTCLSAQAREAPDDPLNYFIGGCASGIFLGARTHSAITGTSACLGLGTLAFFTKVGKMEGWKLAGPPKL
ncbi:NADH dehydrogenase [ubiquinone] 1 alpha subcomplex subunit 11 [Pundamilia nyererei]|uniref:NADH dehydrogenase [ubiquinone] 1 alpha subcomplex subunit 11 n=1 Tax=Pundamilia nyererei TaxID=303518 RepID=A0A9Y3RAG5_9CICH|nr:PREDICTED: NADH dehydrogenase [ubiquinone] 1 alpha subcomplex subunit 11 [Pundamilia nyererei]